MKKLVNISLLHILLFVSSTYAQITYREAKSNDIDSILLLYKTMPENDKKNLFLFPTIEMQKNAILKSIEKKRLVVAVDNDKNKVIGFSKNYIVDEVKELDEILQDEFTIVKNETTLQPCLAYKTYSLSKEQHCFKQFPEPTTQDNIILDTLCSCLKQKSSSIFIYTGGYYTHPEYRALGINTQLCLYQLKIIFTTLEKIIPKKTITHIALLYGQVLANTKHVGMIREFAYCLQSTLVSDFTLHHYLFKATKPEFKEIHGELKVVFLSENEGRGSIVIAKIPNKKGGLDDLLL